ncbi:hypothetical protein HY480_02070 [Candidatus Uhrbacteria bacterium]|nr:hypothetical protein [Candidatus Uhrbacteria bacterium]
MALLMPSPRLRVVLVRVLAVALPLIVGLWWELRSVRMQEQRAADEFAASDSMILGAARPAGPKADPAALQAVLDDPLFRALTPLAPPVVPKELGNAHPFSVLVTP